MRGNFQPLGEPATGRAAIVFGIALGLAAALPLSAAEAAHRQGLGGGGHAAFSGGHAAVSGGHAGFAGHGFAARRGDWHGGWGGGFWGWPGDEGDDYDFPYSYDAAPYSPGYAAAPGSYWYYCQNPAGYYPYVQQCNGAWQPVPPQGG
jgi:hypothetical protein